MLRITIELLPHGDESRARKLGTMAIANDATGTHAAGNYVGTLHAEYTAPGGRKGRIIGFRRQRQSVWSLVGAFLKLWGHTKHVRASEAEDAPFLDALRESADSLRDVAPPTA